jgi:hypothetical protein
MYVPQEDLNEVGISPSRNIHHNVREMRHHHHQHQHQHQHHNQSFDSSTP